MEKSYLIIRIQPFYKNKLKELVKQPKLYFVDTGIRNVIAKEFFTSPENKGKMFENYVLTELIKAGREVKYWQTKGGSEVDFIIQNGKELIPIEVKSKVNSSNIERGMNSFINYYKPKKAFVVFSEGKSFKLKRYGCEIRFVNIKDLIYNLK